MKTYSFFFYYNKPASKQAGCNKLTIHYRGQCYLVDSIECDVPIQSKDRKAQPHCVMSGKCKTLAVEPRGDKYIAVIV
jgi:hypothetical protein